MPSRVRSPRGHRRPESSRSLRDSRRYARGDSGPDAFPASHRAGNDPEDRVRLRAGDVANAPVITWRARAQLAQQVLPLVLDLAARDDKAPATARAADPTAIESILPCFGLRSNIAQVIRDATHGRPGLAKAEKLWVMTVAARCAPQHRLREQPFAPERDEPCGVEVPRMETPEPHAMASVESLPPSGAPASRPRSER